MADDGVLRLAMWSGPRNISTAMMRAFENRPDSIVIDEPLYAHFLKATGIDHPGREEVIAAHEPDWRTVVATLTGPVPPGVRVYYQKHMTHHLLPEIDREWIRGLTNVFLIRDPKEMLLSLSRILDRPTLRDTGLPQQVELFERVREWTGATPIVIDARDVLTDPRHSLSALCERLGIPFMEEMLAWPAGRRESDGVWAQWWYHSVEQSTGFEQWRPREEPLPESVQGLFEPCIRYYETLRSALSR